jgi:hypothetical protein
MTDDAIPLLPIPGGAAGAGAGEAGEAEAGAEVAADAIPGVGELVAIGTTVVFGVVSLIKGIVDADNKKREAFTQHFVDEVSKQFPKCNVVIVHPQHKVAGPHVVHQHHEVPMTVGTCGYDSYCSPKGQPFTFENLGDGGYINWAFAGEFNRNGNSLTAITAPLHVPPRPVPPRPVPPSFVSFEGPNANCYCLCDSATLQGSGTHSHTMNIQAGAPYLYAVLTKDDDSVNFPTGVTLAIQGPDGTKYDHAIQEEKQLVIMSGPSVRGLLVQDPKPGNWTMTITAAERHEGFHCECNTVPTTDVYDTITDTFHDIPDREGGGKEFCLCRRS